MTVVYDGNAFLGCIYLVVVNTKLDKVRTKKLHRKRKHNVKNVWDAVIIVNFPVLYVKKP